MKLEIHSSKNMAPQTAPGGDEKIASLFQPDTLLAEQYLENFRRKTFLEPEKTLMLAVLEDAVRCFQDSVQSRGGKKGKLFDEARDWFFSDDSDWLFSFFSICAVLGLDPGYIRRGLQDWHRRAENALREEQPRTLMAPERLVA